MQTLQPLDAKKCSTKAAQTQVAEASAFYVERWRKAIEDERCVAVLQMLFAHSACSPTFALTARRIARLTGLHHQVVRRLIRGDKRSKARLQGLVAWLTGKGRRGTRYWLTPEGKKVAELLARGLQLGEATLRALATDRLRRKMAHTAQMAHINGTPTENNMPYGFNYVCRQAVTSKLCKPIGRGELLSPLAEKLHRDFHIVVWVANDVVQRYSTEAIEVAMALCEKRNGRILNKAGFIIYLLREGFAQSYAEARHRARQCPEWNEPDIEALRAAPAPYGISVDDDGFAAFANGRLALPPNPSEALARLRDWGFLPTHPAPPHADCAASRLSESASVSDQPDKDREAEPSYEALSELMDAPADSELIDEPTNELTEPLPEPVCVVCQRHQNDLTSAEGSNGSEDKSEATDLPAGTCPRCGSSGELHPFEPQPFTQPFVTADPELVRWSGKALCEPCRCYLRVREGKILFGNAAKRTTAPADAPANTHHDEALSCPRCDEPLSADGEIVGCVGCGFGWRLTEQGLEPLFSDLVVDEPDPPDPTNPSDPSPIPEPESPSNDPTLKVDAWWREASNGG